MLRGAIIAALMLSGCSGPSLSKDQRAEVENIAEDFADGATSKTDTSAIEFHIKQLEERADRAESNDAFILKQLEEMNRDIANMSR